MTIHPTAIVNKNAKIANEVRIGPFCYIEEGVEIGEGTILKNGVVIRKNTRIGKNNLISHYVIIGEEPQDKKFAGEESIIEIGDNNIIREFATFHRACGKDEKTIIGSNNYIMCYSHFGHNSILGSNTIIVNNATLGGYSIVEDYAYISAFVALHPFTRVGKYSIIGGGYCVRNDITPFGMAAGEPLRIVGINSVGLKRNNFTSERIEKIKEVYKILFWSGLNTNDAVERLKNEENEDIKYIIEFIEKSKRGITKGGKID